MAECGVTTEPIIDHFDLFKNVPCRFIPCTVLTMIDEFAFQCAERAFDTRVVPAIPPTRHAAGHPLCREQLLVCPGGILAAPIRVVQHPADRGAGREIEDSCEREPALRGPDRGAVPGPHPIRTRDRELAITRARRDGHPVIQLRRGAPLLHGLGPDPFGTHEARDAVLANRAPCLTRASQMLGLP